MWRCTTKAKSSTLLGLVLFGCSGRADLVAASYGDYNPDSPPAMVELAARVPFRDPWLVRAANRYWLYGTGTGLEVKSSNDLRTWSNEPAVFASNPSWIVNQVPKATELWAPAVAQFGGLFHLYYSASVFASNQSCIGHATAANVETGFTDSGPVVCSNVSGQTDNFNAIDPSTYVEPDGSAWLVFGSYDSGIKLIALDAAGARKGTEMDSLAQRPSSNPAIQAPFLYKWRDYYYLFVSFDQCCQGTNSTHNIRVGRSAKLHGPYVDKDGVNMIDGGGTRVVGGNARWAGPGSNVIFEDGAQRYNVFHAYDSDNNGTASLRIAEIAFDNEGWPVSAGP